MSLSNDIFLQYRPFPAELSNEFIAHWHEVALAFFIYEFIFYILAPIVNTAIFGDIYTNNTNKKLKTNFDIHVVSMVQCILSVVLIVPMFFHPNFTQDPIFGRTDYGAFVASVTVGYFIWDLIACVQYYSLFGIGFLLHAIAALYVFLITFIYCQPWIPGFLIFELSTPFVNINWFCSRLPETHVNPKLVVVNGLLLMFTFFSVRIVWGFYAVAVVIVQFYQVRDELDYLFVPFTVIPMNFLLDCLNVFWFSKMVKILRKKLRSSSKSD